MFPKARKSLHMLPSPASSPTGVGAFVEPKIITRRHVDFWVKEGKNTLEAYWDSYTRAAGNHPSTKSKVPKEGNKFKVILSILILANYYITSKKNIHFIMLISQLIYLFLINILIAN